MEFILPFWALPAIMILNLVLIIWVFVLLYRRAVPAGWVLGLLALLVPLIGPLLALVLLYRKRYEPARRLQP